MIDISKQVNYWRDGAKEDWDVAVQLVESNRARHGLFFAHLALEKALKAHVCRQTLELAPKIHNLIKLAELSKLTISDKQLDILAEMNRFNMQGRYPDTLHDSLSKTDAIGYLKKTEDAFLWLTSQL
jgi:HEPN domain-containing protein